MKNNKGKYYILMMAGILILTFLVPVIIRAASRAFINRFAPAAAQAQTEADEDRYRVIASSDAVKMKAMLLDHTAGPNRHIRVGPISEAGIR